MKSLKEPKHPRTQTELRSFLGMCNVYQRFVPNFAEISTRLNKLLTKGQAVNLETFGNAEASAFTDLVNAVKSSPILELPQLGLPFEVNTDASANQFGCALFQVSEDGERHPIGFDRDR